MRIVIDMQGAQTESRFRGIGRYTLSFALAVVRNRGEHEVFLALSGLFPDTIEPIRAAFDGLLPQEYIRVWHAPGPVKEQCSGNDTRREAAELIREAFLASLDADVIHICSLFEGYADDAVTSIGRFDKSTFISVTLHDLIPLLSPDKYLNPNPKYSAYYHRKLDSLKQAALYLAISKSSRKEIVDCLSVDEAIIATTYEGVEPNFRVLNHDEIDKSLLTDKLAINRPFVLYTGGADERKNLPRLIEAWSALPVPLRLSHQLLFAGRMPEGNVQEFRRIAHRHGLQNDELLFSGYISDEELVQLYNLCKLYVFPSWHEGFGLPALEAMACSAPVIGANTTSLPEVIGLDDALFDPFDVTAIRDKIQVALTDESFLAALRTHACSQAKRFSWDTTAQRAITAWENLLADVAIKGGVSKSAGLERCSLVQAIARDLENADDHQLIHLATCIAQNESAGVMRQLLVDISELCQHDSATGVQRVVRSYLHHLLRNPPRGFYVQPVYATLTEGYRYAHAYTARLLDQPLSLMDDVPVRWQRGDIFFGLDMQHHVQLAQASSFARLRQDGVVVKFLVYDLLPIQLADFFKDNNMHELHGQWLSMVAMQDEAICISKATADAYEDWIARQHIETASGFCINWVHMGADLEGSKPSLGMPLDAPDTLRLLQSRPTFLSVSTLEPRKAQTQILDAVEHLWARDSDVNLVLVGQQGWKIEALVDRIVKHPENGKRLFWLKGISDEYLDRVYQASTCLVAASINEGFGLPLIEAARHGVPIIARDIPVFREVAGPSAFYFTGETGVQLATALGEWLKLHCARKAPPSTGMHWLTWQQSTEQLKQVLIGSNYPRRQLLVDISELVQRDARTGIQRVVRSILKKWLENPPDGFKVEPVFATIDRPYHYARQFAARFLGEPADLLVDEPIGYHPGDIFFALDLNHHIPRVHRNYLQSMYQSGVDVRFLIYDLLPIQFPEFWGAQNSVNLVVEEWMTVVAGLGGAICISKAVADDFSEWLKEKKVQRSRKFKLDWFHLGADTVSSAPSMGLPEDANEVLLILKQRPSFLMVGTVEPRKGHEQVLNAFENLWGNDSSINLVIVGKCGWMVDSLVKRLRSHSELNKRLFWLEGISDEYLEKIYAASICLIAASYGEGFGLPLIEAAQHKLPIIARDIPVFREVAGEHAYYFGGLATADLANAIEGWLALHASDQHPRSDAMPWLTWAQSAQQLLQCILPNGTQPGHQKPKNTDQISL